MKMSLKPLDPLDMEFQYYSCLFENLVSMLPTRCEQIIASSWCRKLSEPLYNAEALRDKRNRYLLMLTICITLNGLRHPFDKHPSDGVLEEISSIRSNEKNKDRSGAVPVEGTCDLHQNIKCPADVDNIGKVLDKQFEFLINLAKPYVPQLSDPSDRLRGRKWVSLLTSIESNCFHMKGVRNDYAMLLAGYLINDELPGPFLQPPIKKLVPLEYLVKIEDMSNNLIFDPAHPRTLKFFRDIPHPENGAFAFIAVSGEICDGFAKRK